MKNQMSIIFFLIMFLCNSFGVYAQSNMAGKSTEKKITKITIASEPDYPPYCFIDKNGNAEGFSIDLFNAAAKAVGIEVNIKIGVWRKIKKDLAEGKIDALPLVGRTPERESLYDFTLSYISLHGAVFVREGTSDINSLEDLFDKEILVMKGDNAEEFVRREHISKNIFLTNTYQEAFQELANGEH
ncbi:MAG: transporter substrate-binding domain-containing protein, partial [Ignavibacteria bacterium]|nr:transporter substrate-binding domain-containing protein [Ignavibacteria bacterium]